MLNPGDEVILPAPYWVSYIEMIRMCGAVPVVIESTHKEDFKITAEKLRAAITDKTKLMILNNPSNPTGMIYSREELQALADVCVEKSPCILFLMRFIIVWFMIIAHIPVLLHSAKR